jgi:hypothetical protein
MVLNFHASFPVAMSTALIQQPSPVNRAQPLRPCSTFPLIAIDPLVAKCPLAGSPTGVSQRSRPVVASSATMRASLAAKRILSCAIEKLRSPAVAGTLFGTGALFPDEIAALRVERLHDVVRVEQIQDAVVHERMRLVRAAFRHRPHPRQLQIADVGAGDLLQRAVAPAVIVAAEHQPVAGIGLPQHLVADRDEVLDAAGDRQPLAERRRGGTRITAAATSLSGGRGRGRRRRGTGGGPRAKRRAEGDGSLWRQRLRPGPRAVRLQQVGDDIGHRVGARAAGIGRRHRRHQIRVQFGNRLVAPLVQKVRAGQLRRLERPLEVGAMTARAAPVVRRAARARLRGGERGRLRRLRDEDGNRRASDDRSQYGQRTPRSSGSRRSHGVLQYAATG